MVALVTLCKQEHGIAEGTPLVPSPLTGTLPDVEDAAQEQVVLLRVSEVENVNALRPDQHLDIGDLGLTVVYGENGAGKSGYVRILKQLCRARGGRDSIYSNVYVDDELPASALLEFRNGATPDKVEWSPGCAPVTALGEVSIFDARSASVYVTEENDVAYLPRGMDLFPRLVAVTEEVKRRIEHEISLLEGARDHFDSVPTTTKVWEFLQNLGVKGIRKALSTLKTISDAERAQLLEWRQEEKRLRTDDAAGKAKSLRLVAARVRSIRQRLVASVATVSDAAAANLRGALREALTTREAARIASTSALSDAPVRGVGSDIWRKLWDIAKQFAIMTPTLEQNFPPTADELCLLCQQPISADAAKRLARFDEYVRSKANAQANKAEAALATLRRSIEIVSVEKIVDEDGATELETLQGGIVAKVRGAMEVLAKRQSMLLKISDSSDWPTLPSLDSTIAGILEAVAAKQIEEAIRYEQAVNPSALNDLTSAIQEMEARIALTALEPRVLAQVEREERRAKLKACLGSANTAAITKRNTDLLKDAVTTPLADEFLKQLKALELTHIPIGVEASHGQKGKAFHTVALGRKAKRAISSDEVLSEGEQRCIALAAFFAEVSLQNAASTLVFDDPVSSLDHGRRKYVAQRLAELGKTRPILVFTHDLTFLWMLQGSVEDVGVPLAPRLFRRDSTGAGIINEEWPWDGQKVSTRIGVLKNTLVQLKKAAKTDRPQYEAGVRLFYGRLRDTWERAVEEVLFNGAIRRFDQEIQTLRLKSLHKISEAQMQEFERGMTRTSEQAHDHPPALALPIPEPEELEKDLQAIEQWVSSIRAVHK